MESKRKLSILLLISTICSVALGYKVLMVCPAPTRSHHNLCKGIVDILIEHNHEVTFINTFPRKNPDCREIGLPELMPAIDEILRNSFALMNMSTFASMGVMEKFLGSMADTIFANSEIQNLLNDPNEKFDTVITEYILNEYLFGFSVHFDCPLVVLSPVNLMPPLAIMTDNPLSIATVPNVFATYSANMNLWQRVINAGLALMQDLKGTFKIKKQQEEFYKKFFPEESKKVPFAELKYKIASTLVNSHPSNGVVRPLLPNTIEIGGYHIKDPEPLPSDIKEILDGANDGLIYFSLGTNLKSSEMSEQTKNIILEALGSLKQTVLWKFEKDLPEKPKNVIIKKWLPQTGILNDPNTKLFITHGGLLSITEAAHFGIPMLVLPVLGDQYHNALEVTQKGLGVHLNFKEITVDSLITVLNEALMNKIYSEKAKHVQQLFLDRPIKPRDLIRFQIEHVIRTNGAVHLSPPRLPRYSQMLIDVALVLLMPFFVVFTLIVFCCKKCYQKICYCKNCFRKTRNARIVKASQYKKHK